MRRQALYVLVAAIVGSAGALALKEPCVLHSWDNWYQYKHYCYSDILPLYFSRHVGEDHIPYLQEFTEYPVLSGFFSYAAGLLTSGLVAYMEVTFALLLVCGGVTTFLLWKMGTDWRRTALWAAGPALIIHGLTNWDLFAVVLAVGGWYAWTRGRPGWAALLFGLGGAAKVYPAFFLPFLWLEARPRRQGSAVAAGSLAGLVLPNLIVWRLAPKNWLAIWQFHAARNVDWETPWEVLRGLANFQGTPEWHAWVSNIGIALMVAGGLALLWLVWRGALSALAAGTAATVLFLLCNRVYSPQYTLWALPFLLALRIRWWPILGWLAADLGNFLVRYPLMTPGTPVEWVQVHNACILLRWLFLGAALWFVVRPSWAPAKPAVGNPAVTSG
ncbi:MAG: glycosyltransferase 87 family protein [Thermoplasmatota archaeon]